MGRKALEKERKPISKKQKKWFDKLLPYLYENGARNPTMDDISAYLNLSKATVYNYYSSKEDLVHDVLWYKLEDLARFKFILLDESIDFVDRYFIGLGHFTQSLSGMSAILLDDLKLFFPKSWESILLFREKSIENISGYYQEGISRGYFKSFNIRMMAKMDLVFFDSVLDPEFLRDVDMEMNKALDEYFKVKFNGILR